MAYVKPTVIMFIEQDEHTDIKTLWNYVRSRNDIICYFL